MRHVPLERRVGLKTQSGNISMTTVLAEGDAMALRVLCATDFAAECSCGAWNDAALSGAGSTSSEPSGCGDERRGRCFRLRTGLRNFLRLSEAMRCQFCLPCAHAFLIWFWCCPTFALTREQKGREAPLLRVGVERVVSVLTQRLSPQVILIP